MWGNCSDCRINARRTVPQSHEVGIAKIAKGAQLAEERLKKRAPQNQEFHAL